MTQQKLGRNYNLSVELPNGEFLEIKPPFTIEFSIIRKNLGSLNISQIRIYNLSNRNRNLIRYDIYDYSTTRKIKFYAGYGDNLPLIFSGNISQAWSVREGVDFITTIESFDGGDGLINGIIDGNAAFPSGTSMENIYKNLINYLPNTTFGAIGPSFIYEDPITKTILLKNTRSPSYVGNAGDILRSITGGAFFIDLEKIYILGNNECINGSIVLINSQTGLLNTPLRENSIVTFDMIFEPSILLAQYIQLESQTFPELNSSSSNQNFDVATGKHNVNGYYKVTSLMHRGMISESVCGNAITTVEFFAPNVPLMRVLT